MQRGADAGDRRRSRRPQLGRQGRFDHQGRVESCGAKGNVKFVQLTVAFVYNTSRLLPVIWPNLQANGFTSVVLAFLAFMVARSPVLTGLMTEAMLGTFRLRLR